MNISQPGYRDYQESGVIINANSAIRLDIKMEIGQVSNTVRVRSDVLQVETQSTQMGDVIQGEKITSVLSTAVRTLTCWRCSRASHPIAMLRLQTALAFRV